MYRWVATSWNRYGAKCFKICQTYRATTASVDRRATSHSNNTMATVFGDPLFPSQIAKHPRPMNQAFESKIGKTPKAKINQNLMRLLPENQNLSQWVFRHRNPQVKRNTKTKLNQNNCRVKESQKYLHHCDHHGQNYIYPVPGPTLKTFQKMFRCEIPDVKTSRVNKTKLCNVCVVEKNTHWSWLTLKNKKIQPWTQLR